MTTDQNKCGTLVKNQTQAVAFAQNQRDEVRVMDVAGALAAEPGMKQQTYVAHSLRGDGFDASEDGTGRGTPLVPVATAFETRMVRTSGGQPQEELNHALKASAGGGDGAPCVASGMAVRRLTPRECERLQGFPDDWTLIPWRKATAENCPDGPRYKALGNSMAVPVMRWIGERIATVDQIP